MRHNVLWAASFWLHPVANLTRGPHTWQDLDRFRTEMQVWKLIQCF
jgi:hypothetical protein